MLIQHLSVQISPKLLFYVSRKDNMLLCQAKKPHPASPSLMFRNTHSTGSGTNASCAANSPSSTATPTWANPSSPLTSPLASPSANPCPTAPPASKATSSSLPQKTMPPTPSNRASSPPVATHHASVS